MVVDFLVHGRPTLYPDWRPIKEGDHSHLLVGGKDFVVEEGLPFQVGSCMTTGRSEVLNLRKNY